MRPHLCIGLFVLVGCAGTPTRSKPAAPALAATTVMAPAAPAEPEPATLAAPAPLVVARASGPTELLTPTREQLKGRGPTRIATIRTAPLLKKKWSTRVGRTTFRSTIAVTDKAIVIGTHGASLEAKNEATDGVYVLAPLTGKPSRFIATPGKGDRDVGGVALDGEAVVFSSDNGQVVKADLSSGKVLWTATLAGKVRPAPALGNFDGKGARDVVVGDEAGDLHVLDGDSGQRLWVQSTGANDYDARGFIAAAAVADLNADGIDDIVAGARDGVLAAYDGRNGSDLWQARDGSGIHASPSLLDIDGDGRLEVLAAWSYSQISIFDAPTGMLRYGQALEQDSGGIEGLFASPVPLPTAGPGLIVQGTAWWGGHHASPKNQDTVDGIVLSGQHGREYRSNEGRVSATAVIMDLGDDGILDAVLGTEDRDLLAISADGTRRVLAKLGGAIEASAALADLDRDGTYELLVGSNDGLLTCFETGSKTRPLLSRFRGDAPTNQGQIASVPLRFSVRP